MTLDPIRAKIIELVFGRPYIHVVLSVTLEHILRAIKIKNESTDRALGQFVQAMLQAGFNLTTDYDGQTQEVREFIGTLLGVL